MGIQVPVGEAQCTLEWKVTSRTDTMVTTIGVRPQVSLTAGEIATAVLDAAQAAGLTAVGNLSNQYTYIGTHAYLQTSTGFITGEDIVNNVGTRGVNPPPPQCCVLAQKHTASGGRANRGRMFLPAGLVDEASEVSAAGEVDGTRRATLEGFVDDFITNLLASDLTPVLFHSDGSPSTVVTSLTVLSTLATQRSRIR